MDNEIVLFLNSDEVETIISQYMLDISRTFMYIPDTEEDSIEEINLILSRTLDNIKRAKYFVDKYLQEFKGIVPDVQFGES